MNRSIHTADGTFTATFSEHGLARLQFPSPNPLPPVPQGSLEEEWLELTRTALEQALRGRKPEKLPPLDLRSGTPFQRAVWNVLLSISVGTTLSYSEVARTVGRPRAMRAAGRACGANPIPILVPCHRVLAVNRKLGGFSGGLDWKTKLLSREHAPVSTLKFQT